MYDVLSHPREEQRATCAPATSRNQREQGENPRRRFKRKETTDIQSGGLREKVSHDEVRNYDNGFESNNAQAESPSQPYHRQRSGQ